MSEYVRYYILAVRGVEYDNQGLILPWREPIDFEQIVKDNNGTELEWLNVDSKVVLSFNLLGPINDLENLRNAVWPYRLLVKNHLLENS